MLRLLNTGYSTVETLAHAGLIFSICWARFYALGSRQIRELGEACSAKFGWLDSWIGEAQARGPLSERSLSRQAGNFQLRDSWLWLSAKPKAKAEYHIPCFVINNFNTLAELTYFDWHVREMIYELSGSDRTPEDKKLSFTCFNWLY